MPILYRLLPIAGETPGFLLPVFLASKGANQELIQRIDENDRVIAFEPIAATPTSVRVNEADTEVEIDDPAIWAFRDHRAVLHIGQSAVIKKVGFELLALKAITKYPLAAAELASFCDLEIQHPEILRRAFRVLSQHSPKSAQVWRDCTVLLPSIKRECAELSHPTEDIRKAIREIQAVTLRSVTHIFASPLLSMNLGDLSRSIRLARIFGIKDFKLHVVDGARPKRAISKQSLWTIVGTGGIARLVINGSPFSGSVADIGSKIGASVAYGPIEPDHKNVSRTLLIGLVPSNPEDAAFANLFAKRSPATIKHAINLRPIGFGTPRADKPQPSQMQKMLSNFDFVWLQANHRQKQTGNFANSLSASNSAVSLARMASSGLIECLNHRKTSRVIAETTHSKGLGLFGAMRHTGEKQQDQLILKVLHGMLCEDAQLHSAERIVVLWPYTLEGSSIRNLELGAHRYRVEVLSMPRTGKLREIVSLAINVQLSTKDQAEFGDLCVSLLSGYGFRIRERGRKSILLGNEGLPLRIWPVVSNDAALRLLSQDPKLMWEDDWIVSNQTITRELRSAAKMKRRTIIHYSEFGRLMKSDFRIGTSKDY